MTTIAKEMLARWVHIREQLEANSDRMTAADIHIDWSDICVLDAYLSDDWNETWMGPKPTAEPSK